MTYKISYTPNPASEDIQVLGDGLEAYAAQKKGLPPFQFFGFFIRDENNQVMGGCSGDFVYGCLYVGYLWVHEKLRGQDYGTQLMHQAEELGHKNGCTFATVNTMDWEALKFYKKLGYEVEFERHGFQKNSILYFLRKELV